MGKEEELPRKVKINIMEKELTFKERQIEEGWKRLKALGVLGNVSKDFKVSHKLYYSERQSSLFNAVLYWVSNNEGWEEMIKAFEEKTGHLVYHAQLTHFEFGDLLSLFIVSKNESEWELERRDLQEGQAFVYCIANPEELDFESDFSEYGSIGIKPSMGGVTRTW